MFAMRRCAAVLLLGIAMLAPATSFSETEAGAAQAPREVVAALYKRAIGTAQAEPGNPFFEAKVREARFSPGFRRLIASAERAAARDGGPAIDFDPITASQDPQLRDLKLATDALEQSRAVVSAHFLNQGQPTLVVYDLVRDGGSWKIDDIRGTTEKQAWSVRQIMRDALASTKAPGEAAPPSKSAR